MTRDEFYDRVSTLNDIEYLCSDLSDETVDFFNQWMERVWTYDDLYATKASLRYTRT